MAKKSGLGQDLIWRLEALTYDLICLLLRPFPFHLISAFGGWVLRLIGPLTRKHKIAEIGLRTAFPDASDQQIKIWLEEQWDNTGRTFAEFPILHHIRPFENQSPVTVKGLHHLETLKTENQVAVFMAGHYANWEVMAIVLTQFGLPVQITYRKINNPYLDKKVRQQRQAYGTQLMIPKSGIKGARQLMDALSSGQSIALMNDQKFNEGIAVPFFGTPAMTAPGPVRLALKSQALFIPLSVKRDKARFEVTIHDPLTLKQTDHRNQDIYNGVVQVNQFIETVISKTPSQWFWVHRRWPKEHYRQFEPSSHQPPKS